MSDDIEVEDESEDTPATAAKFHIVYVVPFLFAFLANLSYVFKVLFAGLSDLTQSHSSYVSNRDLFEAEAGAEIERLVKGDVSNDA